MDHAWVLLLLGAIIWFASNTEVHTKKNTPSAYRETKLNGRSPLAKGKSGLVQCGVTKNHVPKYQTNPLLRRHAQELAISVANGKRAIAAHMDARRQGVCTGPCTVDAIIAGVVRDRKELKKLEYDQPF